MINKTKKQNERTNLDLWSCILGMDIPRAPFQHAEPRKQKGKEKRRLVWSIKQKNKTKWNERTNLLYFSPRVPIQHADPRKQEGRERINKE